MKIDVRRLAAMLTDRGIGEADPLDGLTDHLLVVEGRLGGDLAEHHHHSGLAGGFASDLAVGIVGKAGIQDGIRDLIAELVYYYYSQRNPTLVLPLAPISTLIFQN
jgi:hypothetical protein